MERRKFWLLAFSPLPKLFPWPYFNACVALISSSANGLDQYKIYRLGQVESNCLKGGYLDFSHLTELKNRYITEIYIKKQYKSSITKNHKI